MNRFVVALVVLVAASSFVPAAIAHAEPAPSQSQGEEHLKYPVPAAAFRERVTDREAKARARMEQYIVDEQIGREKADAIRALFQAAIVQINAKVDEVCADGTVTGDEARAVHELAMALRRAGKED